MLSRFAQDETGRYTNDTRSHPLFCVNPLTIATADCVINYSNHPALKHQWVQLLGRYTLATELLRGRLEHSDPITKRLRHTRMVAEIALCTEMAVYSVEGIMDMRKFVLHQFTQWKDRAYVARVLESVLVWACMDGSQRLIVQAHRINPYITQPYLESMVTYQHYRFFSSSAHAVAWKKLVDLTPEQEKFLKDLSTPSLITACFSGATHVQLKTNLDEIWEFMSEEEILAFAEVAGHRNRPKAVGALLTAALCFVVSLNRSHGELVESSYLCWLLESMSDSLRHLHFESVDSYFLRSIRSSYISDNDLYKYLLNIFQVLDDLEVSFLNWSLAHVTFHNIPDIVNFALMMYELQYKPLPFLLKAIKNEQWRYVLLLVIKIYNDKFCGILEPVVDPKKYPDLVNFGRLAFSMGKLNAPFILQSNQEWPIPEGNLHHLVNMYWKMAQGHGVNIIDLLTYTNVISDEGVVLEVGERYIFVPERNSLQRMEILQHGVVHQKKCCSITAATMFELIKRGERVPNVQSYITVLKYLRLAYVSPEPFMCPGTDSNRHRYRPIPRELRHAILTIDPSLVSKVEPTGLENLSWCYTKPRPATIFQ